MKDLVTDLLEIFVLPVVAGAILLLPFQLFGALILIANQR